MKSTLQKPGRSFAWFNVTQFLGALNDNIFKLLLILFLIGVRGPENATIIAAAAGAIVVVPFLLFSAYAGRLADRYSKRDIIVYTKLAELAIMVLGCAAFSMGNEIALYIVLFLMSLQSAFFGPSKYGIIRELSGDAKLAKANSIIQACTYIAIITGTALGPFLSGILEGRFLTAAVFCVAVSAAGVISSLLIERTAPARGSGKASLLFIKDIWRTLYGIRRNRPLLWSVLGAAYFTLFAAFIYLNIIPYGLEHLSLTKEQSGYLFVLAGIGVAAGALWSGKISGRGIELGTIPLGAAGLVFCMVALGTISPNLYLAAGFVVVLGISAGLYIVPIRAFIQLRSPTNSRAEIIAASSFLGWCGVLGASGFIYMLSHLFGLPAANIFVVLCFMALIPAAVTFILLFEYFMRFVVSLITRLVYRIDVRGAENIPPTGGTLIICNHASYADPAILDAAQDRAVCFVMYRSFYNLPFLKPLCKLCRTVPISGKDSLSQMRQSIRRARQLLKEGRIVCIFPEGGMTRNGNLRAFKNGYELIVKGIDCKIIPAYIGGTWKSFMSYYYGKPLSHLPRRFRPAVSVHFGKALPCDATLQELRQKVSELSCDYYNSLKSPRRNLAYRFIRTARRNWHRRCISDITERKLNYGQTLTSALVLSRRIEKLTEENRKVGIMLPPSVGAVLTNIAVTLLGKVPVNLNYVAGKNVINSAIEKCDVKCVISCVALLEKDSSLQAVPNLVLLEDIVGKISRAEKLTGYLRARLVPAMLLNSSGFRGTDDLATVMFSSGTSGRPKGIMLSHHNIISNIESMLSVFKLKHNDNLCAVLPFFHSFGFTCSLWLPIVAGVSAAYVPNPLDGKVVGEVARRDKSTIFFAAPTFLLNYIRRTEPEDFSNLRFIITGAEKLRRRVADSFENKFGIRPKEGYGATELSPVLSLNLPDEDSVDSVQPGSKEATVGHPIPGCAVKTVDPQTHQPTPAGWDGLLLVKGPNVMLGYLDEPNKNREVLKDGWYNTGDIANIDGDGFLTITDRLSRFSKIAGEMVPHLAIEEAYHKALDATEQVVAVTSVPDEKKGEELVVLHCEKAGEADKLHRIISDSELPNLWKPKKENYIKIDALPALGSGKIDLLRVKEIAAEVRKSGDKHIPGRQNFLHLRRT